MTGIGGGGRFLVKTNNAAATDRVSGKISGPGYGPPLSSACLVKHESNAPL